MKNYQFYIYGRIRNSMFCRMIFLIDDNDQEVFVRAEMKQNLLTKQMGLSHYEAVTFVKDNKLKLIDEFKTRI